MEVDELLNLKVEPGSSVAYSKIEEILGLSRNETRFRTVTGVWRKKLLRERGWDTISESGEFRILSPAEALNAGISRLEKVGRAAGRTVVRVEIIEAHTLSPEEQRRHMMLRRYSRAVLESTQEAVKQVAMPKAVSGSTLRVASRS